MIVAKKEGCHENSLVGRHQFANICQLDLGMWKVHL